MARKMTKEMTLSEVGIDTNGQSSDLKGRSVWNKAVDLVSAGIHARKGRLQTNYKVDSLNTKI